MNIFKSLFGKPTAIEVAPTPTFVDERLFVSNEEPVTDANLAPSKLNALEEIIARNFVNEGFSDGYESHNVGLLANRMESMVAEYRLVFRSQIQQIDALITELQPYLMDEVKVHMKEQYVRILAQHDQLKLEKAALEGELELAVKGEGLIEKAICDYRLGFEKGFALFTDERLLTKRFMNY